MTSPWLGNTVRKLACTVGSHRVGRALHRDKLLIVMYHGVTRDPNVARRWWHHVLDSDFERQLRYLKAHYDVRPIDDALTTLWSGGLERPTACVTFDDGYRNNSTVAFPILKKLEIPATIYVATGMIGTHRRLWTVELDHAFTATRVTRLDLGVLGLGTATLHGDDHRALFRRVLNTVKEVAHDDRPAVLQNIFDQLRAPDDPLTHQPFLMMAWDEVKSLSENGLVSIGAHTVNHEIVSRLNDHDVRWEIVESIRLVEQECASVSRTFAYPNGTPGDFDTRAIEAVRSANCIGAVTTIEELCYPDTDRFALGRIGVGSDTSFDQFRLLTSGIISDVKRRLSPTKGVVTDSARSTPFQMSRDTPG